MRRSREISLVSSLPRVSTDALIVLLRVNSLFMDEWLLCAITLKLLCL